jgi:hypothetical protein
VGGVDMTKHPNNKGAKLGRPRKIDQLSQNGTVELAQKLPVEPAENRQVGDRPAAT